MFNQFTPRTIPLASVVGTWKAVNTAFINGQQQTELAVAQFKPDGSFVEGFDLANNASTYQGRYSFDTASQRISFIIDSTEGTGPQPVPFQQPALSSTVFVGNTTVTVGLNNDLTFAFQSTSVAPSDFVLPPASSSFVPFTTASFRPFTPFDFHSGMFNNGFAFHHSPFFAPF